MFKNIKILSQFNFLEGSRFVYEIPSGAPETPPAVEAEPGVAAKLEALKESVAANFREHLDEHKKEVMNFLGSNEAKNYNAGKWKEWNVKLLEFMDFEEVTLNDSEGIIRRLQEYLKSIDSSVIVDGKFGPQLKQALTAYYKNLDRNEGWVPGKTKVAFFNENNYPYYLTHDGRWIDREHEEVDMETVLPILAGAPEPNNKGYYEIKSPSGVLYFVDRKGNAYKNRMPDFDGATGWNDDNPYLAPAVQGEEPEGVASEQLPNATEPVPVINEKKEAPTASELIAENKIDGAYSVGLNTYIYRTKDNKWIDYEGKELALADLGKIRDSGKYAGYYKVTDTNGRTIYVKESDGSVHQGIEIENGQTIAQNYAKMQEEEDKSDSSDANPDLFPGMELGDALAVRSGPVRRTILAENVDINKMEEWQVKKYLEEAGFNNVTFRAPDHYLFEYREMKGSLAIRSESFFQFSVDQRNGEPLVWMGLSPEAFVKRKSYRAGDMPKIAQLVKEHLEEYQSGLKNALAARGVKKFEVKD